MAEIEIFDSGLDIFNQYRMSHDLPGADNTYDLGSVALSWRNLYVDTIVYVASIVTTTSIFINDTANTLMTMGMTINQGASDNEAFALKSSDVDHGMTARTETDTYGLLMKCDGAGGGLALRALSSANHTATYPTLLLMAHSGIAADTTKSTAGRALTETYASLISGSGEAAVTADGNLFAVRANTVGTVAIVDEDGDLWLKGGITSEGGNTVFNEGGGDFDFRIETVSLGAMLEIDSALGSMTLGHLYPSNVYLNRFMWVARSTRTATADTIFADLYVGPSGAVTIPTGTAPYAASVSILEPNITATGTVTVAATLYIVSAPTEGTTNAAIYVASGDTILQRLTTGGTTPVGYVRNDFGGNFTSDGGATYAFMNYFNGVLTSLTGDTAGLVGVLVGHSIVTQTIADQSIAYIAQVSIAEPTITNNLSGTGVITVASTLYISGAPTEGVTNAAIYIVSGDIRSASGDLVLGGGDIFNTQGDIQFAGSRDSGAVADTVAIGGYEIGAGNRVLAISQETAVAADVDETKFSNKLQVRINGATYFIMLTTT